jgi:hypothetical protein
LARAQTDYWAEFRKSAADLYDGFVSLIEPIEDMQPHRRAEHERRRALFVERQCMEMADAVAGTLPQTEFWKPGESTK